MIAWTKWIVAAVCVRVAVAREVPAIFCPTEKSVVASVSPGAWTFPDRACYMLHKYTSYMCYTLHYVTWTFPNRAWSLSAAIVVWWTRVWGEEEEKI